MSRVVVLVTGGTGLVGQAIQKIVAEHNYSLEHHKQFIFISSKDADLRNYESTRNIFKEHRPAYVINLAAKVGGLFNNMRNNIIFYRDNMAINQNVLQCCEEFNVEKCISCLSTCIFPDKTSYPIDETMVHAGTRDILPIFTSVIPCNVFGPHDNYSLQDGHALPALMHKMYMAQLENKPVHVLGSGRPMRQFIYSIDLARLILRVLDEYNDVSPIILSVGEEDEISIGNAATKIKKAMKLETELIFGDISQDGQFKKTADNRKLKTLFPDFVFTPFEDAITQSCHWFIENFNIARK